MNKVLFNYTQGGAFTIPDFKSEVVGLLNYRGYYNITNDIIYSGRVLNENSVVLTKQDNILGNYLADKLTFNRSTVQDVKLTYNIDSLFFQPNEIVNQNSINEKIEKLNLNFFDLYNFCFIRNNNLPINYTRYIGVTGAADDYLSSSSIIGTSNFSTSAVGLTGAKGFEVIGMNLNKTGGEVSSLSFLLIYFTATSLHFYKADSTGASSVVTFLLSTDSVDGEFSQKYVNITDITTNNRDSLFVTDSHHNQIYRLYIDPILNESRISGSNLNSLNTRGFKLNTGGHTYLSGSNLLYFYNSELYTYNMEGKNITVLDDNLSFKRKFTNKLISSTRVLDFAVDSINDRIYVLLENFNILYVDVNFATAAVLVKPTNSFESNETPKRFLFSTNDSSIYYIITTKNIYKYLKGKESDDLIGKFKWAPEIKIPDTNYEIFDTKILLENEDYDSIFILEKNINFNGQDKLLKFTEDNNLVSNLHSSNFKIFAINDILLKDEYFNNITFNKCIKKLLFNLDILSSYIHSRFTYVYNENRELQYDSNILLDEIIQVKKDYNFFVGVNERVTPQIFNRCINEIYKYQLVILEVLKKEIKSLKYPYTEVVDINI
jgi:hypothetical protein